MAKKRIMDFRKEFSDIQSDMNSLSKEINLTNNTSNKNSDDLTKLEDELKNLGIYIKSTDYKRPSNSIDIYSEQYFLKLSREVEKNVTKEINSNLNLLPSITKLDFIAALTIGTIGAIIDMLFVKIPKDVAYLGKYEQEGSGFTKWLKSLGINEDGKLNGFLAGLEKDHKVSFDASSKSNLGDYGVDVNGFYPKTHRLMSLGHDPFYGLVFGLLDILNGSITFIDSKGVIHNVPLEKFQDITMKDKLFAPLLWVGHILSDICTKMGIPVPGWGFTQLLQFGSFGKNDRSIADLARYMYLEGYDLRHFLTMGTVPAVIEICTRLYYKLTLQEADAFSPTYAKNIKDVQDTIRLQKLLFTAHSVAASGNVLKIILYQGNPLAFNVAQLLGFVKQSIQMVQIELRVRTTEKIVRNREQINDEWKKF